MSSRIQWELYGKCKHNKFLSNEQVEILIDQLCDFSDDWYSDDIAEDHLCDFMTDCHSGYDTVTQMVEEFSATIPEATFRLECHNTDEDWYQHIYFQNGDREAIDGDIAYDEPRAIRYDAPSPSELLIVLQGGSVQGVFANSAVSSDVTIVDRDLSKLEYASPKETCDTAAWIEGQLERCRKMQALYGSADHL